MNYTNSFVLVIMMVVSYGCGNRFGEKLTTRSIKSGDYVCIVQRMPASYGGDDKAGQFDYYRLIIESSVPVKDKNAVDYVNFGIQDDIKMVMEGDSVSPAILQRVANGKKNSFEYLMAFDRSAEFKRKEIQIAIDDKVLGIGKVSLIF